MMYVVYKKGFTLIELLVVIAIIGMLSAVVLGSLNSARAKARDARRQSDIIALRNAFLLYVDANGGSYPAYSPPVCLGGTSTCWTGYGGNAPFSPNTSLNTALSAYITEIPADPLPTRTIGDRYLYFRGAADIHCGALPTVTGTYLAWLPDSLGPTTDAACKPGVWACCSGLGCGSSRFCLLELQ